jgi:hypothetical protein
MSKDELPRFNMPYELGLDVGASEYGGTRLKTKKILILETERYHYKRLYRTLQDKTFPVMMTILKLL